MFDALLTTRRFLNYFIWFAVGAFARPLVERWARVPLWVLPLALGAYVPVGLLRYGEEPSAHPQLLATALSLIGITFFLGASQVAAGWGPTRRLATYLASRTLPIYLLHPMLLALLIWLTPGFGQQGSVVSAWLVPALVVLLTWASCAIYDRTRSVVPLAFRAPTMGGSRARTETSVG